MATSTKRLSAGLNTGVTRGSTSRGQTLVGTGSSPGAIATAKIQAPSLVPQAQPIDAFQRTGVPQAPGVTSIPTPPPLPEPSPDAQNLANSLESLNSNLTQFTSAYLGYEKQANEAAKKEAAGIAAKLAASGGNLLRPIDKIRNDSENIANNLKSDGKTPANYSAAERALAKDRYDMLRNIDPRTNDYLGYQIEKQQGLRAVSGLLPYIQSLKTEEGGALIVNPVGVDGQPSEFDIQVNNYLRQNIQNPDVFAELQPQILAQTTNARSWMASEYSKKQDIKLQQGYTQGLDNSVGEMTGDGTALAKVFTTARNSGMSTKAIKDNKSTFLNDWAGSIVQASGGDRATLIELLDKAEKELTAARVGPGDKPPLLTDQLLGDASVGELRRLVYKKATEQSNASKQFDTDSGTNMQESRNNLAIDQASDSDLGTEGRQDYTYTTPDGETITTPVNLLQLSTWIQNERSDIYRNETNIHKRNARLEELNKMETNLRNGRGAQLRESNYNDLQDRIDAGDDSAMLYSTIRYYERRKLITKDQASNLTSQIIEDVRAEDKELRDQIELQETNLYKEYEKSGKAGDLLPTESDADQRFSAAEIALATNLLRPIRIEARKIMKDDSLNQAEKKRAIDELYKNAFTTFNERLKVPGAFRLANDRYLQRNGTVTAPSPTTTTPTTTTDQTAQPPVVEEESVNDGLSSDNQPIKELPPIPEGARLTTVQRLDARRQAIKETRARFAGMLKGKPLQQLGAKFVGYTPKVVRDWYRKRLNEIQYEMLTGVDPRGRGETKATKLGLHYADTPAGVLENLSGGNRGDKKENLYLIENVNKEAFYSTPVFVEQINAIEAGDDFIPYSTDLNKILKRMGITSIEFFEQQYKVHTGTDMPQTLKDKLDKRLGKKIIISSAIDETLVAGGPSFDINESGKTRKIRGIRKLQEGGKGGESDNADKLLKKLGGPQLPLAYETPNPAGPGDVYKRPDKEGPYVPAPPREEPKIV